MSKLIVTVGPWIIVIIILSFLIGRSRKKASKEKQGYCSSCGKKVGDDWEVCAYCGETIGYDKESIELKNSEYNGFRRLINDNYLFFHEVAKILGGIGVLLVCLGGYFYVNSVIKSYNNDILYSWNWRSTMISSTIIGSFLGLLLSFKRKNYGSIIVLVSYCSFITMGFLAEINTEIYYWMVSIFVGLPGGIFLFLDQEIETDSNKYFNKYR
ncbi:hypothetical protein Halha_1114 [Halobacteroides halobius DSM 5150]|uniref:Zinc-ribbon domain-containing protein n=1 Tax=Halobacteroides halobius (strain ATCC 35273 / DSM 5150 / MD-1) TaxID=748449 RepID=L0K9M0_HALHC|nr:zinc ribbon domain-containing protein [Halobacteroides halobius]AGB41064.1 hypothetical protein Halha_1114 [Halobacteroides halobius DSM 5150]